MQFYKINFGYTQVLFMGSVPRINRPLATVSRAIILNIPFSFMDKLCRLSLSMSHYLIGVFYRYDKQSKGVSILFQQLPYTLQLVKSYPVTSNSKAA